MDYSTMKVPELKQLLKERNLPQTGNKGDLIVRLQQYDNSSSPIKVGSYMAGNINGDNIQSPSAPTITQSPTRMPVPSTVNVTQQPSEVLNKPAEHPAPTTATTMEETSSSQKRPAESSLSEEERKRLRAEKFGVVVEADKIAKRGERFGTGEAADKASIEKIKSRAERFGVVSPIVLTEEEKSKIEKRKERFGNALGDDNSTKFAFTNDPSIAKRQSRFGVVEPEKPKAGSSASNRRNGFNNRQNNNRQRF